MKEGRWEREKKKGRERRDEIEGRGREIFITFSSRVSTVLMTVLSRLSYISQLWSPTKIHQIIMIEKI